MRRIRILPQPKVSPSVTWFKAWQKWKADYGKDTLEAIIIKENHPLGQVGDVVEVNKKLMRTQLYPNQEAVYAVEENLRRYSVRPYRVRRLMEEQGMTREEAEGCVDRVIADLEERRLAEISTPRQRSAGQ